MSKFKVGDTVKIAKGFPSMEEGLYYNPEMEKEVGKFGIVVSKSSGGNRYTVDTGPHDVYVQDYVWLESSLEFPVENRMPELKSGMRVKYRNESVHLVIKDLNRTYDEHGFNNLLSFDLKTGKYIDDSGFDEWDIVKVFEGNDTSYLFDLDTLGKLVWDADDADKIAKQKRVRELGEILQATQKELDSLSEY